MVEAVYFLIDKIHAFFNVLAVDVGGVRLDSVIILLIIVSFFASLWFKGVRG